MTVSRLASRDDSRASVPIQPCVWTCVQRRVAIILACLTLARASAPVGFKFTPGGLRPEECVHSVPSGAAVSVGEVRDSPLALSSI
jgi:hypothetical protein